MRYTSRCSMFWVALGAILAPSGLVAAPGEPSTNDKRAPSPAQSAVHSARMPAGVPVMPTALAPAGAPAPLAGGNDDCATPEPIVGGSASFDCTVATTGAQGQSNQTCLAFGTTGIDNDVWFVWVPDFSGLVDITTCPLPASDDTRIAIYLGTGCPVGEPIECNDDFYSINSCSWVTLEVVSGQAYTIQVGVNPGSPPVAGHISFYPKDLTNTYAYDDGTSEGVWGPTSGGEYCWLQRYNAVGGSDRIVSVSAAWGSPVAPTSLPNGVPVRVLIWDDPNEDGDPTDARLLADVATNVANINSDILNEVAIQPPVVVTGKFFVGTILRCPAGEYVAPTSDNWWGVWSWTVANSTGAIDAQCLACNTFPPSALGPAYDETFLLRAQGEDSGVTYCFGDGTGANCPCGNFGQLGAGCENSTSRGSQLYSVGSPSVAADTLSLWATSMPFNWNGLIYMGTNQLNNGLGVPFGDGLRCVGGTTKRFPSQGFGSLVQDHLVANSNGLIVAGSTWHFQAWFLDSSPFAPCGNGANLSNGLTLTFLP